MRLREHGRRLDDLASRSPCLRRIRVSLLIDYEQCLDAAIESLDFMTESPKIIEVKVEHTGYPEGARCPLSKGEVPTFATWTKQHGLVWHDQAIEGAREIGLFKRLGTS